MQTIVSVLLLLVAPSTFSYPVFGTKRYQRASYPAAYPLYQPVQSVYGDEPLQYNGYPTLDDNYYYQPPRAEHRPKYGLPLYHGNYQPLPFYFVEAPAYDYQQDVGRDSPMDSLHDEMAQEESFPEGQEVWFEPPGHNQDSLARVNAAFLHNLMLYNDHFGSPTIPEVDPRPQHEYEYDDNDWYNAGGKLGSTAIKSATPLSNFNQDEDEDQVDEEDDDRDVQELKALVNKHRKEHDSLYGNQDLRREIPAYNQDYQDAEYDDTWINWDSKRSAGAPKKVQSEQIDAKKPVIKNNKMVKSTASTTTTTTQKPPQKPQQKVDKTGKGYGGQKEIVLPRPATPVRHPFRSSVLTTNAIDENKKNSHSKPPSGAIYDTIKQILAMEQKFDENKSHTQQKRYVSNEEALVQQLNGLKRQYSA